jgi:UDP-GlcNAc:undecaprenyl-phosphate GlcNAc-1-phosphate transferase
MWILARAVPIGDVLAPLPAPLVFLSGLVWIVAFQNAVNFLDNMDGIVAGIVTIALAALVLHVESGRWAFPLVVGSAALGFLPWNARSPARLFLGDAGSLPLGHALGVTSLAAVWTAPTAAPAVAPVIVVLIPIVDITFVTLTRLAAGRSPAVGGRDHTTHRLFARVGSVTVTRRIFWGCALVLGAASLWVRSLSGAGALVVLGVAALACTWVGRRFASMPSPDALAARD